jgi:hypothetical protein
MDFEKELGEISQKNDRDQDSAVDMETTERTTESIPTTYSVESFSMQDCDTQVDQFISHVVDNYCDNPSPLSFVLDFPENDKCNENDNISGSSLSSTNVGKMQHDDLSCEYNNWIE